MNIAFLGRGKVGFYVLRNLLEMEGIEVKIVINCTHTPETGGSENEFFHLCMEYKIPYYKDDKVNDSRWINKLTNLDIDLGVALYWVRILKEGLIRTAKHGFLNLHGGPLPRYRGNACANWEILKEENHHGITVHFMQPGKLDSGPILEQEFVPIKKDTKVQELMEATESIGGDLVLRGVKKVLKGDYQVKEQKESEALYCFPRIPRDGEINWDQNAEEVDKLVRAAGPPYPGAYSFFEDVRDDGRIKKMIILDSKVIEYPIEFNSVNGHVVKLEDGGRGVVCGDGRILQLLEISINGQKIPAEKQFQTVRQRMGLDQSKLMARILENSEGKSNIEESRYHTHGINDLTEKIFELKKGVQVSIERLTAFLKENEVFVELNPLRDYSFKDKYFEWEKKEKRFGIQIYQSLRLIETKNKSVAIGLWIFSNDEGILEKRVFSSVKIEEADLYGEKCEDAFCRFISIPTATLKSEENGLPHAWYAITNSLNDPNLFEGILNFVKTVFKH